MTQRYRIAVSILLLAGVAATAGAAQKAYKKPGAVPAVKPAVPSTQRADAWPVPDAAALERASKLVRSTLADLYKPANAQKRRESASELLRQGVDTRDDPAARYVLLSDAADFAAGAGESLTACRAIDELAKSFQIDPLPLKVAHIAEAAKTAFTRDQVDALASSCDRAEEEAIEAGDFDQAKKLASIAQAVAVRAQRVDLKTSLLARQADLQAIELENDAYLKARAQLAQKPGDPAASLTAGRFLCFVKGEWDTGLPMLAAGADDTLRALAARDLAAPRDATVCQQLGTDWWDLSAKQDGLARAQVQRRAVHWYQQARPGLTGVSLKTVSDRLTNVESARMRSLNLVPGLAASLYDGQKQNKFKLARIDPTIDFDWKDGAAAPGMPKDDFSIRWLGVLNVPATGQYTFVLIVNDGASLAVDGATVFDEEGLSHSRNGKRVPMQLTEGLHTFELKFWDGGGLAKMRLLWEPPGSTQQEVVPPSAFWHEAGQAIAGRGG